jgi:hypothetical protein
MMVRLLELDQQVTQFSFKLVDDTWRGSIGNCFQPNVDPVPQSFLIVASFSLPQQEHEAIRCWVNPQPDG